MEAAQYAKLDVVWCIPGDDELQAQVDDESGQVFQINALTATEQELVEALKYLKTSDAELKKIDPDKVAKLIVAARTPDWKSLQPLTKLKCGIGAKKVPILGKYLVLNQK